MTEDDDNRLEKILELKCVWNDGYRTAIRKALAIVIGHVDSRELAANLARLLLVGYEHPMDDAPL